MYPKWQGGADSARPYKNQFRGHFDPNFSHNLDCGKKIAIRSQRGAKTQFFSICNSVVSTIDFVGPLW